MHAVTLESVVEPRKIGGLQLTHDRASSSCPHDDSKRLSVDRSSPAFELNGQGLEYCGSLGHCKGGVALHYSNRLQVDLRNRHP
jgi:hypothetical protein